MSGEVDQGDKCRHGYMTRHLTWTPVSQLKVILKCRNCPSSLEHGNKN